MQRVQKKGIECLMPTTGEETISRSEMQRRVAERQQRELEAQGLVEVPEATEEEDGNEDDVDMGGMGEAERRNQHNVPRPTSAMQEEDLFPPGGCQRPPCNPSMAPTRGDSKLSDVDEADPVRQNVTRRQSGDQPMRKRKRTPEGESLRRNVVKVARTAEDVGADPVEQEEDAPVELALGEAGIVTVTDDTFVEQQGANIEGVDTDDDKLPTTGSTFDATSRLFNDHNADLQAFDGPSLSTTTRLELNWNVQPLRRPDGTYNPVISADSANTFNPDVPPSAPQAGTPAVEMLGQRPDAPEPTEQDNGLEDLDANEVEVAYELTEASAGVEREDANRHVDRAFGEMQRISLSSLSSLGSQQSTNVVAGERGRLGGSVRRPELRSESEPVVLQNLAEGQNAADDEMSIRYNSNSDWLSPNRNRGWRYEKKP